MSYVAKNHLTAVDALKALNDVYCTRAVLFDM